MEYRKTTAHGKIILFGEHTVLYGGGAVAIPFGVDACILEIFPSSKMECKITPKVSPMVHSTLVEDWKYLARESKLSNQNFEIKVQFNLPPGGGFGISASWSVALVRWLQPVLGWSESECLKKLQLLEDKHHGKASGIDHMTIWNEMPQVLLDGVVEPLEPNQSCLEALSVFYTGKPKETTLEMIERVKNSKNEILFLNKNIVQKLKEMDIEEFMNLINKFGRWLEDSGAVNPEIVSKFENFRTQGGAVKICGAGGFDQGSGAAVAWHKNPEVLKNFLANFKSV